MYLPNLFHFPIDNNIITHLRGELAGLRVVTALNNTTYGKSTYCVLLAFGFSADIL